ncbi:MAG: hypothetical protein H3C47_03835 [Candidatus Cloacimonetes bacterium]|nr:hypothetical protein [Candidatus Cloacimonadota bacterium]
MLFLRSSGSEYLFQNFTRSTTFFFYGLILGLFNLLFISTDLDRCFDGKAFEGKASKVWYEGKNNIHTILELETGRQIHVHKNVGFYIRSGDTIQRNGNSLFVTINEKKYLTINYTAMMFFSISLLLMVLGISKQPKIRDLIYTGENSTLFWGMFILFSLNGILL